MLSPLHGLQDPTSWSLLPWVEDAHSALPGSATGMSAFQCVYGDQPPVSRVSVLQMWAQAWATLLLSVDG